MCQTLKNASKGYYNFCYVGAPGKLFVSADVIFSELENHIRTNGK